jgi:hypothetical protein
LKDGAVQYSRIFQEIRMKSPAAARPEASTIVTAFACAMVAVSIGGMLHRSQGLDWNPSLQAACAGIGAMTYLLVREAVRFARKARAA